MSQHPPSPPPEDKRSPMRYLLRQLFLLERKYRAMLRDSAFLAAISSRHLFSFHAQPLARGLAVGMFWMVMPMPLQMAPAAVSCLLLFANLPVALLTVWISNPFTYLPIFYLEYKIGALLFGDGGLGPISFEEFSASYQQAATLAGDVYIIIVQGALVLGVFLALIGYGVAFPLSRYMLRFSKWRLHRH